MTSVYVFGVILALLFISGLVVAPLLEDEPADAEGKGGGSPEERREAALEALDELQFEHETGKLSDDDYRRLKARYARAAVEARRAEESEGRESEAPADEGEARAGDEDPGEPPGTAVGFCAACGAEVGPDDRFCARCGSEVA